MPIIADWYDKDETIIHLRMVGKWTWEELHPVAEQCGQLIRTKTQPVDFIADFTESQRKSGILAYARQWIQRTSPRVGIRVLVRADNSLKLLLFVAERISFLEANGIIVRCADSCEEAYQIIVHERKGRA